MRNLRMIVLAVIIMLSILDVNAYAQGDGVSGSGGVGAFYNYVWRGMLLHNGISIQPDVNVSYQGLTFDVWSHFETVTNGWAETDLTLSYSVPMVENLLLKLGAIAYIVSGAATYDGFVTFGYNTFADLSLSVYAGNGDPSSPVFAQIKVLHSFGLAENFSFDPNISAGINFVDNYFGEVAAPLNYAFSKNLTIGAIFALDAGNKQIGRPDGIIAYGGVIVTANF